MKVYVNGKLEIASIENGDVAATVEMLREMYGDDANIVIAPSLEEAKAEANEIHANALKTLTGDASTEERDTWERKAIAAEAFLKGQVNAAQTAMLATEAELAGRTPEALAMTIKVKSIIFQKMIGFAAGMRSRAHALIDASEPEQMGEVMKKIREGGQTAKAQAAAEAAIIKACAQVLAEGDPEKLTTDNKPKVEVLEAMTGIPDISGPQRDEAVSLLTG